MEARMRMVDFNKMACCSKIMRTKRNLEPGTGSPGINEPAQCGSI
jgi:hypothetical protein